MKSRKSFPVMLFDTEAERLRNVTTAFLPKSIAYEPETNFFYLALLATQGYRSVFPKQAFSYITMVIYWIKVPENSPVMPYAPERQYQATTAQEQIPWQPPQE